MFAISNITFASITPPAQDNNAYILMDYDTGTILAQKNADTPPATCIFNKNDDQLSIRTKTALRRNE